MLARAGAARGRRRDESARRRSRTGVASASCSQPGSNGAPVAISRTMLARNGRGQGKRAGERQNCAPRPCPHGFGFALADGRIESGHFDRLDDLARRHETRRDRPHPPSPPAGLHARIRCRGTAARFFSSRATQAAQVMPDTSSRIFRAARRSRRPRRRRPGRPGWLLRSPTRAVMAERLTAAEPTPGTAASAFDAGRTGRKVMPSTGKMYS